MSLVKKRSDAGKTRPAMGGGGVPGHQVHARAREKIRAGMLLERLEGIVTGKYQAEPHQVTAALGLLKKALPDLSATDITSGGQVISVEIVDYKNAK